MVEFELRQGGPAIVLRWKRRMKVFFEIPLVKQFHVELNFLRSPKQHVVRRRHMNDI
jgi:hypothetical protein